jgi:ribosomal protein L18E
MKAQRVSISKINKKGKPKHVVVIISSVSFRYIFYTIISSVRLSNYIYFK